MAFNTRIESSAFGLVSCGAVLSSLMTQLFPIKLIHFWWCIWTVSWVVSCLGYEEVNKHLVQNIFAEARGKYVICQTRKIFLWPKTTVSVIRFLWMESKGAPQKRQTTLSWHLFPKYERCSVFLYFCEFLGRSFQSLHMLSFLLNC